MSSIHIINAPTEATEGVPSGAPLTFPCSLGQQRFWVLDQLDPSNSSLNVAVRWRLQGDVLSADLESAFQLIIARHEVLRTSFADEAGDPIQIVHRPMPFRVPVIDLRGLPPETAQAEADRIAGMEARTAFNLAQPPLIRITQVKLRDSISILLVTVHHIVSDGWSIGLLAKETRGPHPGHPGPAAARAVTPGRRGGPGHVRAGRAAGSTAAARDRCVPARPTAGDRHGCGGECAPDGDHGNAGRRRQRGVDEGVEHLCRKRCQPVVPG